jgi:hypothetical protein
MIKTDFLGWKLVSVLKYENQWRAEYGFAPNYFIVGFGESPESACADAQREIQIWSNKVHPNRLNSGNTHRIETGSTPCNPIERIVVRSRGDRD